MIYVKYAHRTIHKLFSFMFASLISELSGVELVADEIEGFPMTKGFIKTREMNSDREQFKNYIFHKLSKEEITNIVETAKIKDIYINGKNTQNMSYYEPYKDYFVKLTKVEDGDYMKLNENDIAVHIRLGEFFNPIFNGAFEYDVDEIYKLLTRLTYDNVYIITDSPSNFRLDKFRTLENCKIMINNKFYDYRTLNNANRIIISPSCFGLLAAWTGNAKEIYFPNFGNWIKDDFNLRINEDRIIFYP